MEEEDAYNYSLIAHYLHPFVNPLNDKPFIAKMEDNYCSLLRIRKPHLKQEFGCKLVEDLCLLPIQSGRKTKLPNLKYQREGGVHRCSPI